MNEARQFSPKSRADWRRWLEINHTEQTGVWVVWHKKHTSKTALSYDDMVEEALCFGWIDSVPRKIDEDRTSLYFSPRKPKSVWSQSNKVRIARLEQLGVIEPAGLAAINVAKANGSWDALNDSDSLLVPNDLEIELSKYENATTHFSAFPPSSRKAILSWIYAAKTDATRQNRVAETAQLAEQNIRANQWQPKKQ